MPHLKTQLSAFDRRRFMRHTWDCVTASVALAVTPGRELFAASSFGDNPFTLGVALGDPTPDGIVLWTRLAPDPVDAGRLGHRTIPYNPHIKYYEATAADTSRRRSRRSRCASTCGSSRA